MFIFTACPIRCTVDGANNKSLPGRTLTRQKSRRLLVSAVNKVPPFYLFINRNSGGRPHRWITGTFETLFNRIVSSCSFCKIVFCLSICIMSGIPEAFWQPPFVVLETTWDFNVNNLLYWIRCSQNNYAMIEKFPFYNFIIINISIAEGAYSAYVV